MRRPEGVVKSVMTKLDRKGKGIILMHDFQQATARAVADLLNELKARGYKVVHMKAKTPLSTLAPWMTPPRARSKALALASTVQYRAWCEPLWITPFSPPPRCKDLKINRSITASYFGAFFLGVSGVS